MSVKIFTMTHKKFNQPEDRIYVPLHVGRAQSQDFGYVGDHTGDNISAMNCYYGELTGVYWIWKNEKVADYVGVCHYRRYLINAEERLLNEAEYTKILSTYDLITTKRLKLNFTYYEGYAANYNIKDLVETGKVLKEKYPEYYSNFERMIQLNETYFGNIMVTSKKLFDEYTSWLFDIFFEVQKRIDPSAYDDYHKRVFGFISEFLLMVWVDTRKLKAYECKIGMTAEKYETREMIKKLAELLKEKDIAGAKTYFTECIQKRPDVLMEASDISGELKLSMQVIATCDLEYEDAGSSILDEISDFAKLMRFFRRLNDVVNAYRFSNNKEEDTIFLSDPLLSCNAIQVAVMVLSEDDRSSSQVLLRMAMDMEKLLNSNKTSGLLSRCLTYDENNETARNMLQSLQNSN